MVNKRRAATASLMVMIALPMAMDSNLRLQSLLQARLHLLLA
jgi:hypothetical protein